MTKKTITLGLLFMALLLSAQAQGTRQLPPVSIQTLEGTHYSARDLHNDGKPFVVSFWATWCRPCLKELTAIDEIYPEWQELGFKLIAISTDNARTRPNVLPMVNGRGWEFEFYLDENGDLQRAMGVNLIPHTFILNGKGEVIYQHTAFSDGMEWEMFDMLKDLLNADE